MAAIGGETSDMGIRERQQRQYFIVERNMLQP
jgi:hypothetical protein